MIQPYQEDFFQRIVNVQWGGVLFVYAEELGNELHWVRVSGSSDAKPTVHRAMLAEPDTVVSYGAKTLFGVTGSSYANINGKPVFLVCGTRSVFHEILDSVGNVTGVIDWYAHIYASADARSWQEVYTQSVVNDSVPHTNYVNTSGLVWFSDESSFYSSQFSGEEGEQVFSSKTGAGWSGSGSNFTTYCANNNCLDSLGQHVPDGVMVYDTMKQITARPVNPPTIHYDSGNIDYAVCGGDVEVIQHSPGGVLTGGVSSIVTIPGIALVTCVAGSNGVFMAGGFINRKPEGPGAVALSVDGGQTWAPLASTSIGVTTMIAALGV